MRSVRRIVLKEFFTKSRGQSPVVESNNMKVDIKLFYLQSQLRAWLSYDWINFVLRSNFLNRGREMNLPAAVRVVLTVLPLKVTRILRGSVGGVGGPRPTLPVVRADRLPFRRDGLCPVRLCPAFAAGTEAGPPNPVRVFLMYSAPVALVRGRGGRVFTLQSSFMPRL